MMSNSTAKNPIIILPDVLVDQIAAGEVIQRPASVVKELLENSIDAGANRIEVVIKNAGKDLIRIVDNGIGMSSEALSLATQRHATSKIRELKDLERLNSYGFRGEALASIAAVSQLEIASIPAQENQGERRIWSGGKLETVEAFGGKSGTDIAVKNLFFNTPARRKFLKGKPTETRHITEQVVRVALSNPELRLKYSNDKKTILDLPSGDLKARIGAIFQKNYSQYLQEVNNKYQAMSLDGYVGNLNLVRKSKGEQYLFLNGRYIQNRLMNSAVFSVFRGLVKRSEYPFFVLNLQIDPAEVDVNVHPTKIEVKFADEWRVYNFIKMFVAEALRDIIQTAPSFSPPVALQDSPKNAQFTISSHRSGKNPRLPEETQRLMFDSNYQSQKETDYLQKAQNFPEYFLEAQSDAPFECGNIWQIHNKYICAEIRNGIVIIDQHVAHERVLYEKAMQSFSETEAPAQQLLFPVVIEFSPEDYSILLDVLPFMKKIGFQMRNFGGRSVVLEGVPGEMRSGEEGKIIKQIIDYTKEYAMQNDPVQEKVAAAYACKGAVKAGDPLTKEELQALVDQLFATEEPYFCPHGRPIVVNYSLDEIDKRFERT